MGIFKVRLRTNEKPGAEATDATLRACPMGGGFLERDDETGEILFDEDGLAKVIAVNSDFMKFACKNQGYVAQVFE